MWKKRLKLSDEEFNKINKVKQRSGALLEENYSEIRLSGAGNKANLEMPWYDYVEPFIGISGSIENIPHLPDGKFFFIEVSNFVIDRLLVCGFTDNLIVHKVLVRI